MHNELVFKKIMMNYFSEGMPFLDSSEIIIDLGESLGDDAIYGSISNGSKYLINRINKASNKKNFGQIIIKQLDDLLKMEYNLLYTKDLSEYQEELLSKLNSSKTLSLQEQILFNKTVSECDHLLSSEEKIYYDDVEYNVYDLSDFQKFNIIKDITSGKLEFYRKKCSSICEITKNLIDKNLSSSYQFTKIQPK